MRQTTSLTEFAAPDVLADVAAEEENEELQLLPAHAEAAAAGEVTAAEAEMEDPHGLAGSIPRRRWRGSADFSAVETVAFLHTCGLCKRRLGPGRDTFMYRGNTVFCSLECRQQHMAIEEWKDKCALVTPPPTAVTFDLVVPAMITLILSCNDYCF